MKTTLWALGALVVTAGIVVGLVGGGQERTTGEPIKIGVSTILSGDFAALGDNIVKAAQLAVDDVNAKGGINGRPLELDVQDAALDSKTGLAAAQKLINVDGVTYIIGGTTSNGTLAAAPLVNEKHVVYMTPVTGGKNVDEAGEYVFRVANGDLLAGRDLANGATKLGFKKAAVVTEVTEYTLDIQKSFLANYTGAVVVSEEFQPGTTDFRTLVAKVGAAKPDVIVVLSQTGVAGAHFIKQSRDAGIDAPLFTDFTFVANNNAKEIVGSFDGVYFTDPAYGADEGETKAVFARYEAKYGSAPLIGFHAASTYDSVMMLADALKAVGDDSQKVHDYLLTIKNREGLMGTFSIDAAGNSDLGFFFKQVQNGKFEVVK